ncbi:phytoene dehydrogenase [Saccharomonospora piscinae]|uniref:Phytoene dehydrogenase n=1 Tax=Saccharomonospora piscinae TaxID=687388 RepID=A0A1V9AAE7_SACPI|nr:hydroxysqualene dehydroxylase HpnE [Saccharomonospora piscinae]OQO93904.1 phytoene dehydrogenase [Saccharomonospora piscinae]TLW95075.1 FAD-dependent oxidoreductase [Saccharomonospora piscinae]
MSAPCAQPRAQRAGPADADVVVVGSGLAGLTTACDLADAGFAVTVLEARSRLGGATFSFERDGLTVDNGQHVVLRCCTGYRALLERLGSGEGMAVQERFRVPVLAPGGRFAELRRTDAPAPLHLAPAIARYSALSPLDRARVLRAALALRSLDPDDPALDDHSFGDWLARHGQNAATRERLWDLVSVAALNGDVSQVSLASAVMVFRTALLDAPDAADIGVPRWPLEDLHVRPAEKYLLERGGVVRTRSAVRGVTPTRDRFLVRLDDEVIDADAVVLAVPPEAASRICPERAGLHRRRLAQLGSVPIVNVHVVYDRPVTDLPFAAAVGSPVQWVFDRTAAAGLDEGQYLTVSLSAADTWLTAPASVLRDVFLAELGRLFPPAAAPAARHPRFFVTRQRRATFRQAPGSNRLRAAQRTAMPGLVLAGSWTATGWPDTMEGAVRSGHRAADLVAAHLAGGVRR